MQLIANIIDLLFPPCCELCGRISSAFVCPSCASTLPRTVRPLTITHEAPYRMHFAPLAYRTALRRLVHRYKYGGRICAAAWFAGFIHDILQRYDIMPTRSFDIVTAVPMHPTKRRLRGHDHAERLASEFAALQGLPFSRLLTKVGERGSQTAKGRSHRLRDATSAYHAKETVSVSGKRVILIDDVHTSGATANACAHALRKAGATDVMLITIAKGTD